MQFVLLLLCPCQITSTSYALCYRLEVCQVTYQLKIPPPQNQCPKEQAGVQAEATGLLLALLKPL